MKILYFIPAIVSIIWMIVSFAAITEFCRKRGIAINWFLYRIKIFQYVNYYRDVNLKETGKPGFWYYSLMASIILSIIFGFSLVILSKTIG